MGTGWPILTTHDYRAQDRQHGKSLFSRGKRHLYVDSGPSSSPVAIIGRAMTPLERVCNCASGGVRYLIATFLSDGPDAQMQSYSNEKWLVYGFGTVGQVGKFTVRGHRIGRHLANSAKRSTLQAGKHAVRTETE